ncbi:MAG: prolyl oligopeptidase family serine peptidase [Eubacteriales bacterium]|nr:prolyl oligopeptidase family serine peptidase [Eubacteriales bacterium]
MTEKEIFSTTGHLSADEAVTGVKALGLVDLEGAKTKAIIVEYVLPIDGESVGVNTYEITNYTLFQIKENGYDQAIEMDYDGVPGNEGTIERVYVNDKPVLSEKNGVNEGRYVIIEVNTAYMLSGQNLSYTASLIAGARQIDQVKTSDGRTVTPNTREIKNYTESMQPDFRGNIRLVRTVNKEGFLLPEFGPDSGWTQYHIGNGAFRATHCYSEYTGHYEDFELPYSLFVPPAKLLEANKGKVGLIIHMEHAGSNDSDPMAAVTSSRAAVRLAQMASQKEHPAIVVVPQVEESRRSTDDMVASSEVNTAAFELLDALLETYADYIDIDRIYGTGQSMGGMTILNMASQRDHFFAGIAVAGAQWSNSYAKPFQHNGAPARSPENDPISFSGSVDSDNYLNWYYMISDANVLVQTCADDAMATAEWCCAKEYLESAGGHISYSEWDPWLEVDEQNAMGRALLDRDTSGPGLGITWVCYTRGSHMSTWKYAYRVDFALEWLFRQNRLTAINRGKLGQLKNLWLGRDDTGVIRSGSGTAKLNSAQFTPRGASNHYGEGWTPVSVVNALLSDENTRDTEEVRRLYALLSKEEKAQIKS